MRNRTVAELIQWLQQFPPDWNWNGWDDGSLFLFHPEDALKLDLAENQFLDPTIQPDEEVVPVPKPALSPKLPPHVWFP